jgi:hypothetical protein
MALLAIAAFASVTSPARSDDERAPKFKEAAAPSVKAGKAFIRWRRQGTEGDGLKKIFDKTWRQFRVCERRIDNVRSD